jgi:hypothetical protein
MRIASLATGGAPSLGGVAREAIIDLGRRLRIGSSRRQDADAA